MSSIEIVRSFYDALKRGDVPALLALLHHDLAWTEAEGFPYFSGTWRTPREVAEKLLVPLSKDWDNFSVSAESVVSEATNVVAFGVYRGVNRATGRKLLAPFAHHWRVTDGRISSFVQYTDTLVVRRAMT
jgi:uncharacterized protein